MAAFLNRRRWVCVLAVAVGLAVAAAASAADVTAESTGESSKSMLDFLKAGGIIGILIVLMSFVGAALIIEGFLRLNVDKLLPPSVAEQAEALAAKGKFSEILALSSGSDSMLGRIIRGALSEGQLGMDAVRESMLTAGTREMTRMEQRVGYVGFIASIAPMLGLLGTVTGMIASFNVLGIAKGAARPDELAVGVSEALVTTCLGLIVAVPMMFFHSFLRDRLTRIGQQASGHCERLLRIMTAWIETRNLAAANGAAANGAAANGAAANGAAANGAAANGAAANGAGFNAAATQPQPVVVAAAPKGEPAGTE